jgi:F-type H+-transporting ATPase subunit b
VNRIKRYSLSLVMALILVLLLSVILYASEAEGGEKLISINFKVLLFQMLNFLILLFLLKIFLYKPVKAMLASRSQKIAEDTTLIEKAKQDIEKMKREMQTAMNDASSRANEIINGALRTASEMQTKLEREAQENARSILDKAYGEIEQEKKKALIELTDYASELAISAATRVIGQSMNNEVNNELVKKYIKDLDKKDIKIN